MWYLLYMNKCHIKVVINLLKKENVSSWICFIVFVFYALYIHVLIYNHQINTLLPNFLSAIIIMQDVILYNMSFLTHDRA